MDALLRYSQKIAMRIALMPLRLIPVKKNRVVLLNDLSYKYADNPKFVTEYLDKHYHGKFELIFAVNNPENYENLCQRGIKVIRYKSLQYFFYSMTCSVFVTNSGGYSFLPLTKRNYVINTFHGGGAYKKVGRDVFEDTELFRRDLRLQGDRTDVFMSTCQRFSDVLAYASLTPREAFWEVGMPRNDMLINPDPEKRQKIREKLGLKEGEKLILFAPTYRKVNDNYFKDSVAISYGVDTKRVCTALEKRFGGKWRFAMRYHPCVTNRGDMASMDAMDLTDYEEMQELLLAADAMINDFSSSMWDFMMTGRPSFLFAVDLDHYVATTAVYTPVSEWPFPKSVNNDELEKNILEFDEEKYAAACKRHYEALGGCETGKATELVCQRIYEWCFGKPE